MSGETIGSDHAITVRPNSLLSLTTSPQSVSSLISVASVNASGYYTVNNKDITILKAGTYKISSQIYIGTGFAAGDIIHNCIYQNDTKVLAEGSYRVAHEMEYSTIDVGAVIVTLSANDKISLKAYNQTGDRGNVYSHEYNKTFLTIEKLS